MTLSAYLITMALGTVISWTSWLFVLFFVDPEETNNLGFTLFYLSLFLAISGTLALTGFILRVALRRQEMVTKKVINSFRQGALLSLLTIVSLALQRRGLLTWWNSFFLIGGITVFELFLLSLRSNRSRP